MPEGQYLKANSGPNPPRRSCTIELPTSSMSEPALMPNSVPLTSCSGLSPLIQISSLSPSDGLPNETALSEDSITSSHPRPASNTGSEHFVSIASSPSDGLPNGSALSEESNEAKTPTVRQGKTSRPLAIMQWNADGIRNKLDELKQRLVNSNIDILAIQE